MNVQSTLSKSLALAAAATAVVAVVGAVPADASVAPASAFVANDVLRIIGTNHADAISLDFAGGPDSVAVDFGNGTSQRFNRATFHSATVLLGRGDDSFATRSGGSALTDAPRIVYAGTGDDRVSGGAGNDFLFGGNGDDTLLGGGGNDFLFGGNGDDFINGNVGNDVEFLGSGDDTAGWIPGEGNDTVVGKSGFDSLAFDGSDGDELMSLSANGSHAVFLRNLGNIRMDLDGVERLDLSTFGGVDSVTVNDLTGTDLTRADIDLSAATGAGDKKDDTVVVTGTEAADKLDVSASGGTVVVAGLHAQTRIAGGESTDQLRLDTLGGNDQVTVADAAKALISVALNLGTGQL